MPTICAVGSTATIQQFGLLDFSRVKIYMWSAPTVLFRTTDDGEEKDRFLIEIKSKSRDWKYHFRICLFDTVVSRLVALAVLVLKLDLILPLPLQRILIAYLLGFLVSTVKLIYEIPCRYLLRNDHRIRCIIATSDQPYLTKSPRDLWHRWSVGFGYLLRKGFYDPLHRYHDEGQLISHHFHLLSTAVPFFINALFHSTWWSFVSTNKLDTSGMYWNLLFVYPLVSFVLQDVVVGDWMFGSRRATTQAHQAMNLALLWIGFCFVAEPMAIANAIPTTLVGLSRHTLGLYD